MSKSLNTLIRYSLIPAICLFVAKFVGVLFIASLLNLNLQVIGFENLFSFKLAAANQDIITLSTYSDLFMFMTMAAGFSLVLFNSIYFHETHIQVKTIQKLAKYNLLSLIKSSYELYHTGIVWLVFVLLSNVIIGLNIWRGNSESWVLLITGAFSLALTLVFFKDMFKEIELTKYENTIN